MKHLFLTFAFFGSVAASQVETLRALQALVAESIQIKLSDDEARELSQRGGRIIAVRGKPVSFDPSKPWVHTVKSK